MQHAVIKYNYRYALLSGPFRSFSSYQCLSPEGILVDAKDVYLSRADAKAFMVSKLQESLEYHQKAVRELSIQLVELGLMQAP